MDAGGWLFVVMLVVAAILNIIAAEINLRDARINSEISNLNIYNAEQNAKMAINNLENFKAMDWKNSDE